MEEQFCLKVKQRTRLLQMVPAEDKLKQDQQWVCLGSPQGRPSEDLRIAGTVASKSSQFPGCSDLQESRTHDQADAEAATLR